MEPSEDKKDEASASTSSAINVALRFELEDGTKFKLEDISRTDTIEDVKELVMNFTGIPDANQILLFNGNPLEDDDATLNSEGIEHNSEIQLLVEDPDPESESNMAELFVKLPNKGDDLLSLPVNTSLTILRLKQILQHHMNPMVPVSRMGVYYHNDAIELQDAKRLRDYGLSNESILDVFVKPSPTPTGPSDVNLLTIQVILPCQKRLYLQFDRTHNVQVLRDELERIKTLEKFELPPKYFFVHEDGTLAEDVSFMGSLVLRFDEIYVVENERQWRSCSSEKD